MASLLGYTTPSHVLYADDIMIFCRGTHRNLIALQELFGRYGEVSGQQMNPSKSKVYSGAITSWRLAGLSGILGFSVDRGKPWKSHLQPLADKIKTKLAAWKGSLLSIMGRVQLVQSIIHGMLIYSYRIYSWPISLLSKINGWIQNFIWSGDIHIRKLVTVAWHKVCLPFQKEGLGLRSIRKINEATIFKLSWDCITSDR